MTDFVQTMKDWRRMCEHCDRNEKIGCVVNGSVCAGFRKMIDEIDLEVVETKVTAWAAEHPEPVYPLWGEWLTSIGAARRVPTGLPFQLANGDIVDPPYEIEVNLYDRIPADIAEKLGIEPKEG